MAFITDIPVQNPPSRLLLLGESSSGKTGGLLSLARVGFILHILDTDHKALELFRRFESDPAVLGRIDIESISESIELKNKRLRVKKPNAFETSMTVLQSWLNADFDQQHVIVIDSFTNLGKYAGFVAAHAAGREDGFPIFQDYGAAFNMLRPVLDLLTAYKVEKDESGNLIESPGQFNCHVIVLTHINYYEVKKKTGEKIRVGNTKMDETVTIDTIGYPKALGQSLSPEIPTFFNMMLRTETRGDKRLICTTSNDLVGVKTPVLNLPRTLPIETGLADIYEKCSYLPTGATK